MTAPRYVVFALPDWGSVSDAEIVGVFLDVDRAEALADAIERRYPTVAAMVKPLRAKRLRGLFDE